MNKRIVLTIVIVSILIVITIISFYIYNIENKKENVEIELSQLNTIISEKQPFNEMATVDITAQVLSSVYDLNVENMEEIIGKMPLRNVQASMYIIVKAKEGTVKSVKEQIEKVAKLEEEKWSTYLKDQYELVQNRKLGTKGNYVYLFISENSQELENLIK